MHFIKEQIQQLNEELGAVAVAGPWGSGKSLFALTRPVLPGKQVIWLHTEPSGANYAALYPHVTRCEINSMQDLRQALQTLPEAGHVIIDTIAPIEDWIYQEVIKGLDVKGKPMLNSKGEPNGDANRFAKDKGAAWGETKRREYNILTYLKGKTDALTVTSHLRAKYIGNQPSAVKEPKAKEVVYQFVSLFLVLERVERQPQPAGVVVKTTLMDKKRFATDGTLSPVLPPRLPIADWVTIWKYIETPVDMANLTTEEQSHSMTDEEALRLMAKIAEGTTEG
jgi:hypothetical protein